MAEDGEAGLPRLYGFPLRSGTSEKDMKAMRGAFSRERAREAMWKHRRSLPSAQRLKKMARKGIPPDNRPWIWLQASGANARRRAESEDYYEGLLVVEPPRHTVDQIDNDIRRTFPSNSRLRTQEMRSMLRRVLTAYARHNPSLGYCQSMNYLVAFALLTVGDEESAFWLLVALLEEKLYPGTHAGDLFGALVEFNALHGLVNWLLPRLGRHLAECQCNLAFMCTKWLLCLFVDSLPPHTAARVWDCFVVEGSKVFHRVALAILRRSRRRLMATQDMGDMMQILESACAREYNPDDLLAAAFNQPSPLSRARLNHLRHVASMEVEAEQRRRQEWQKHIDAAPNPSDSPRFAALAAREPTISHSTRSAQ